MKRAELEVLGVFPSFDSAAYGGIQVSGLTAWNGVRDRFGSEATGMFSYNFQTTSRAAAVLQAIRRQERAKTALFWHMNLLKLLPFLHRPGRLVVFLHGIEAWLRQDPWIRRLLKKADLIVTNSDHTWTRFLSFNPEFSGMRHRTVHLGLGDRLAAETPPPGKRPVALMVGRLSKGEGHKGHRQMIDAWPLVQREIPDAELWILGDGNLRPDLERQVESNGLGGAVRFFGERPDGEKERLLAESRCLALPSVGEGFGLVYLEGLRMGRPCLVSDRDAGREVVSPPETGLAANPDDAESLSRSVCRLLTLGSEWESWSRRARVRYESRFTAAHFQDRLIQALTEL